MPVAASPRDDPTRVSGPHDEERIRSRHRRVRGAANCRRKRECTRSGLPTKGLVLSLGMTSKAHPEYAATGMDSRATQCELTDAASRSPKPDVDPSCEESLTERELALWLDHGIIPQADPSAEQRLTPAELLGRAVLRVRLYWGWSQRDLESRSGVDQTTISRLERG